MTCEGFLHAKMGCPCCDIKSATANGIGFMSNFELV